MSNLITKAFIQVRVYEILNFVVHETSRPPIDAPCHHLPSPCLITMALGFWLKKVVETPSRPISFEHFQRPNFTFEPVCKLKNLPQTSKTVWLEWCPAQSIDRLLT